MIFLGLEYASDGPELSNEEIDRQFAEMESRLFLEIERRLRTEGRNDQIVQRKRSKEKDRQRSGLNNLSRYCE
jgi:hypothetical protein